MPTAGGNGNTDAVTDGVMTDEELQQRVCKLAESILVATRNVEEALTNIKTITSLLNRVTAKLKTRRAICDEEQALLKLTELWLREENSRSPEFPFHSRPDVFLTLQTIVSNEQDRVSIHEGATEPLPVHDSQLLAASLSSIPEVVNDGEELDWDGSGVELTDSIHSNCALNLITSMHIDSHDNSTRSRSSTSSLIEAGVVKSVSYHDIYEDEMEMTLELEEGFYSDSSLSDGIDNHQPPSPQTDSGVAQLNLVTSPEHSPLQINDEEYSTLQVNNDIEYSSVEPANYNRDINTWDIFATVNMEDDIQSTASEAEHSNKSTPRFGRKSYTINRNLRRGSVISATGTDLPSPLVTNGVDIRSSSSSVDSPGLEDKQLSKISSLPNLMKPIVGNNGVTSSTAAVDKLSSSLLGLVSADDSVSSGGSDNTTVIADVYVPSPPLDYSKQESHPSLRKNNYFRKPRRPVFV